jgi:hypothetical protein
MPNPKKSVRVNLGGRFRYLRYDFNALIALEEALGVPISQWKDIINEQMGVRTLRTLVWAGLLHEDENLSERDVGAVLDITKIDDLSEKVLEAVELAFSPNQKKKEQGKAEGERNGAGEST